MVEEAEVFVEVTAADTVVLAVAPEPAVTVRMDDSFAFDTIDVAGTASTVPAMLAESLSGGAVEFLIPSQLAAHVLDAVPVTPVQETLLEEAKGQPEDETPLSTTVAADVAELVGDPGKATAGGGDDACCIPVIEVTLTVAVAVAGAVAVAAMTVVPPDVNNGTEESDATVEDELSWLESGLDVFPCQPQAREVPPFDSVAALPILTPVELERPKEYAKPDSKCANDAPGVTKPDAAGEESQLVYPGLLSGGVLLQNPSPVSFSTGGLEAGPMEMPMLQLALPVDFQSESFRLELEAGSASTAVVSAAGPDGDALKFGVAPVACDSDCNQVTSPSVLLPA